MQETSTPTPTRESPIGPGLYAVLGVPRDAPTWTVLASYDAFVEKVKTTSMTYDEPTEDDRDVRDQKLKELDEAIAILSNPRKREMYDQGLRSSEHVPFVRSPQRRRISLGRSLSPAPRDMNAEYPDIWIAVRDGRIRSDGKSWRGPPKRPGSPEWQPVQRRTTSDEYRPRYASSRRPVQRRKSRAREEPVGGGRASPKYDAFNHCW